MFLATVFYSLLVILPQADGRTPSKPKLNYMSRLKSSCENGFGQSCYDFAMYLRDVGHDKNAKKIQRYIHRACLLTYQPACGKPDKAQKARSTASSDGAPPSAPNACQNSATFGPVFAGPSLAGLQIIRLERNSPFEKAGLHLGDLVTKINGKPVASMAEMVNATSEGNAMFEIRRGGALTSLGVSCH